MIKKDLLTNYQSLYLKWYRLEHNLTLKEFAYKLHISESHLSKIETGVRILQDDIFNLFLDTFQIELMPFDENVLKDIDLLIDQLINLTDETKEKEIVLNPSSISHPYSVLAHFLQSCITQYYDTSESEQMLLEKTVDFFDLPYQKIIYVFLGYAKTISNLPNSIYFLKKSLEIPGDPRIHALACYYLTFRSNTRNELLESIHFGEYAIHFFEENNIPKRLGKSYAATAIAYDNLGNYDLAISYYKKAKDSIQTHDIIVLYYFNIGYIYMDKKNFEEAIHYFKQAKALENDNMTCFYLAYCAYYSKNNALAKFYINEGRNAPKYKEVYDLFLDWIESMTKQRYSKKSLYYLQKIEKGYHLLSYTDKRFLNQLFLNYYESTNDLENQIVYLKRLQN